ncbi:MAG: hypothetical protein ACYC25_01165 [Paludibacter sp.]
MEAKYKIGYVDEDIKQVKKYQRRFKKYGIEVIGYDFEKEMNLEDLMKQVYASDIDLLMIDYKLNETNKVTFNGEEVESVFYNTKPLFPHIIFTNKIEQAEPHVEDWKIIFDKDDIFSDDENDETKVQHFITTLERSIDQYKKYIAIRKSLLTELLEKGEKEGLNIIEKDNLFKLQRELKNLDKTQKYEVPEILLKPDIIEFSDNLKDEADEFLQKLIEKRKSK